jgi:LuxR family maltose regulon positive regulatory protein
MRARLLLAQGDLPAAEVWAANSGLNPDNPVNNSPGYRYVEYITLARVFDAQGRHADALTLLERLLNSAESEERVGNVIVILALQSLVLQAQGDTDRACKRLEQALTLAEPEGYIRVFVDEGESMRALLAIYRSQLLTQLSTTPDDRSRRLLIYSNKLLAAFSQPGALPAPGLDPFLDPLTERELEVLHLIAVGASNREIANNLVVAVPTVKKHVSNIMSKLNASSRTQAAAEARALGLL